MLKTRTAHTRQRPASCDMRVEEQEMTAEDTLGDGVKKAGVMQE